ncbi:hypothetical protein Tco_0212167 [Tanacetum coccineum]
MKTPMSSDVKLTKDEECESIDSTKYRGMICSLLYLTASRSDIMFSVCLCSRFQEDPKTSHLEVVKHIFQYIKGTTHLGLWYPKGTGIETVLYADSDHARYYLDLKSTNGICMCDSYKDGDGDASFQLKSDSLPHAHAQTTKTYYKHQDSRIKKAQELKTKSSANSDIQDLPSRYQVYQGRLLASFQDDAKYEHVGQDTRSQGGKDDQDRRIKI